jgi:hypothetical protein
MKQSITNTIGENVGRLACPRKEKYSRCRIKYAIDYASDEEDGHTSNLALVVAAADGFIAITEWSFNAPAAITSHMRR